MQNKRNNSLSEVINTCGVDKKYVYASFGIINVLCISLLGYALMVVKNIRVIIPIMFLVIVANVFFIEVLKKYKKQKEEREILHFIEIFRYLNVYISNGMTVYQSLNYVLNYTTPDMGRKIEKLLHDIDEDKTVNPYIEFSEQFNLPLIREVMINLYLINEEGNSERYIAQYGSLFNSLLQSNEERCQSILQNSLETMCFAPLIGSSMSMALITISVVSMIEGVGSGW